MVDLDAARCEQLLDVAVRQPVPQVPTHRHGDDLRREPEPGERRPLNHRPGRWCYLYRAVDQFGQVIDVLATDKRDAAAARRFFTRALQHRSRPVEVTTDKAAA